MIGTTMNRPGPLTPVMRPSVNMTPRSYSGSTLMEANKNSASSTITAITTSGNMSGSFRPAAGVAGIVGGGVVWAHLYSQTVDRGHGQLLILRHRGFA